MKKFKKTEIYKVKEKPYEDTPKNRTKEEFKFFDEPSKARNTEVGLTHSVVDLASKD